MGVFYCSGYGDHTVALLRPAVATSEPLRPPTGAEVDPVLEVWFVNFATVGAWLDALQAETPRLDQGTTARLNRMSATASRHTRRRAHIALRLVLERHLGPRIRETEFLLSPSGRPSLPGQDLDFSLSHTEGAALIALTTRSAVGVDIERSSRTISLPSERQQQVLWAGSSLVDATEEPLHQPLDLSVATAGPTHDALLRSWVRLEAYAKAEGQGVGAVLERLRRHPAANSDPKKALTVGQDKAASPFSPSIQVQDICVGANYFAALAVAGPFDHLTMKSLSSATVEDN